MAKLRSNGIILVLALVGLLDALFLTVKHYLPEGASFGCSATASCSSVLHSKYGQVGPIPLGLFGAGMYVLLAFLCWKRSSLLRAWRGAEAEKARTYASSHESDSTDEATQQAESELAAFSAAPSASPSGSEGLASPVSSANWLRAEVLRLDRIVWILALMGVVTSWWLQYTALYVILAFCPYCFVSATIITLIFLLASRDYLLDGRNLNGEQKMLLSVGGFVAVCLAFVYVPPIWMQYLIVTHPQTPTVENISNKLDPAVIASKDMQMMGDPNAPYTIVEFADYQCGHCALASKAMNSFMKMQKGNQYRLGFRNFPLEKHDGARMAAIAAEAAGAQGKFWPMHDAIFAHQQDIDGGKISEADFTQYAQEAGLDVPRWKADWKNPKWADKITNDLQAGERGGMQSTPSFFLINPKHKMWRFVGQDALLSALSNPNNEIFQ